VLPIISRQQRKFARITLLSFLSSLLVELIQLVSKVGSFDVDDMILNTLGGVIGYLLFWGAYQVVLYYRKRTTFGEEFAQKPLVERNEN
jgi:hypothetical protein